MEDWKELSDWWYHYRINRDGAVQKQRGDGKWRTLKANIRKGALKVILRRSDGTRTCVPVARLVGDAFLGGAGPDTAYLQKNGDIRDCSARNLLPVPMTEFGAYGILSNHRAVVKLDMAGNILEIYRSVKDAARSNYMSRTTVTRRCDGEVSGEKDGFSFVYADNMGRLSMSPG